jgi:hypothetical protein
MNLILDEQARLRKAEGRKSTYSEIMRRMWESYEGTKTTGTAEGSLRERGTHGPEVFHLPRARQVTARLLSDKEWRKQIYTEVDAVIDRTLNLIANHYAEALTDPEAIAFDDEIMAIVNGAAEVKSSDKRGNAKGGKRGRKAG